MVFVGDLSVKSKTKLVVFRGVCGGGEGGRGGL